MFFDSCTCIHCANSMLQLYVFMITNIHVILVYAQGFLNFAVYSSQGAAFDQLKEANPRGRF